MPRAKLTHVDATGAVRMVDVSGKGTTLRRAVAQGRVAFGAEAFRLLRANKLAKGDALAVARLAGIQGGKRTAELIPLCHTVPLTRLDVSITLESRGRLARITATAEASWSTGVEMEALVAVAAAALALYDMVKAVERGATVTELRLESKSGGARGDWARG